MRSSTFSLNIQITLFSHNNHYLKPRPCCFNFIIRQKNFFVPFNEPRQICIDKIQKCCLLVNSSARSSWARNSRLFIQHNSAKRAVRNPASDHQHPPVAIARNQRRTCHNDRRKGASDQQAEVRWQHHELGARSERQRQRRRLIFEEKGHYFALNLSIKI